MPNVPLQLVYRMIFRVAILSQLQCLAILILLCTVSGITQFFPHKDSEIEFSCVPLHEEGSDIQRSVQDAFRE